MSGELTKTFPTLLKPLIKRPNRSYFVGIDVTHEKGIETFAFCVMEKDKDGNCLIQHSDVIQGNYTTEQDKMYLHYTESLRQFYDCTILMEGSEGTWMEWDPINDKEAQEVRKAYNDVIVKLNKKVGIKDFYELQPDYTHKLTPIE